MALKIKIIAFIMQLVLNFYIFMMRKYFSITKVNYNYMPNKNTNVTIFTSNPDIKVIYSTNKLAPVGEFPADCNFNIVIIKQNGIGFVGKIVIEHGNVYINNTKYDVEYLDWRTILNATSGNIL